MGRRAPEHGRVSCAAAAFQCWPQGAHSWHSDSPLSQVSSVIKEENICQPFFFCLFWLLRSPARACPVSNICSSLPSNAVCCHLVTNVTTGHTQGEGSAQTALPGATHRDCRGQGAPWLCPEHTEGQRCQHRGFHQSKGCRAPAQHPEAPPQVQHLL